jgi:hypothetical protein
VLRDELGLSRGEALHAAPSVHPDIVLPSERPQATLAVAASYPIFVDDHLTISICRKSNSATKVADPFRFLRAMRLSFLRGEISRNRASPAAFIRG